MPAQPISNLFEITPRYLRSTNLERDFQDPRALDNYVLTTHGQECLTRLSAGLRPGSSQRAWRLTGNYGTGKSSFALFLAHWFQGSASKLSRAVNVDVKYERFSLGARPQYLPLLITGSREPMGKALLRGLGQLLDQQYSRGAKSGLQVRIEAAAEQDRLNDNEVLQLLVEANEKLVKDQKATGLLVLLDELGKFLEFAAHHPQRQDVYLLQRLAETASKASAAAPLFVVGMLHQGFDAYAENLDATTQREWEKVAGRFEELVFRQPVLQLAELIAAALRVKTGHLPPFARQEARAGWEAAFELGWLGVGASKKHHTELAAQLYPLHGTVIPAMVRAFTRFGQNERSLFSFLLADEPFGLQAHARTPIGSGNLYRLPQLYDYVRVTFGHRLSLQSYRSHWTQIEAMVESLATTDAVQLDVVKTVGLLNLLDHPDLTPTAAAIEAALGGVGGYPTAKIRSAIEQLHKRRKVLFRRGVAGAYSLWPHTSVDLDHAYERACQVVGGVGAVAPHLSEFLETRALVARRHYIETGNLRHFEVRYTGVGEMAQAAQQAVAADGLVLVVLCETSNEIERADKFAHSPELKLRRNLLIAIPEEPLSHQVGLVNEARRWDWVAFNTPELNSDRFAREEVSRQRSGARQRLESRVQEVVGLRSLNGARALRWYAGGAAKKIENGRKLLEYLSRLCDDLYRSAPLVKNELLNRHSLSSAAARARHLLIGGILTRSHQPYLGMDASKKPPEMSMYMSVLERGRLHVEKGAGQYALQCPSGAEDVLRFQPSFDALRAYLESHADQRVCVRDLLAEVSRPPYGIRSGLSLLVLALFTAMYPQELAFYEEGTFLREVKEDEFLRLSKDPSQFEIQLCRVAGLRAEVFESLLKVLGLHASGAAEPVVLDVVRPLCVFVAGLPEYVRMTRRLAPEAIKVRDALLAARDPVQLLFRDLPAACGLPEFEAGSEIASDRARRFARTLKRLLDDLRMAFEALTERMLGRIREEFAVEGDITAVRAALAARAETVALHAIEPKLKAFCLRLADRNLADSAWLEALGSLLASLPPARWRDAAEDTFHREFSECAQRFVSVEAMAFKGKGSRNSKEAFRIAVTRHDGSEVKEVVFVESNRVKEIDDLARQIATLIGKRRNVGLAALSRATWAALNEE